MPAASQKRISWLKFEPRVSNFPATKTATAVLVAFAIKKSSLFFVYLSFTCVRQGTQKNKSFVFLFTFERWQLCKSESKAIKKSSLSLVYFFLLLFAKVVQSMWRALHQWAVVFGRMMSVWRNASVFETPNSV